MSRLLAPFLPFVKLLSAVSLIAAGHMAFLVARQYPAFICFHAHATVAAVKEELMKVAERLPGY